MWRAPRPHAERCHRGVRHEERCIWIADDAAAGETVALVVVKVAVSDGATTAIRALHANASTASVRLAGWTAGVVVVPPTV